MHRDAWPNWQHLWHVPEQQQLCCTAVPVPEEKINLRLKQMKSKQGNCVSSAATGEIGEKGIPKERLVLATDSKVMSDIKRN